MTNRSFHLYEKIFKYLRVELNMSAATYMCDFEIPLRKAIFEIWPESSVKGCYYHFTQALKRKKDSLSHLASMIKTTEEANKIYQLFRRLAFKPKEDIEEEYTFILEYQKQLNLEQDFHAFNDYILKHWIQKAHIKDFCIGEEPDRTNNFAENFNSKLKRFIPKNPSFNVFLCR